MASKTKDIVIGLGNDFRRDDGVGLYVTRQLKQLLPQEIEIIAGLADGTDLIELWDGRSLCIVIDAVKSGSKPGMIHEFDGLKQNIPEDLFSMYSSHAFSIAKTIQLARTLKKLPAKLVVYGIEGKDFSAGQGLTPAVASAADNIIRKIVKDTELSST